MAKEINENEADIADIQAGLEKRQSLYFFIGAALFMFLIGFSFKTCMVYEASRPPDPPVLIPSVECVRAGGKWTTNKFERVGQYDREIEAYCDQGVKPVSSQ